MQRKVMIYFCFLKMEIQDVKAYHVNEYIQDISGEGTAKDFRTWGGTKLAAEEISEFRKKTIKNNGKEYNKNGQRSS